MQKIKKLWRVSRFVMGVLIASLVLTSYYWSHPPRKADSPQPTPQETSWPV